MATPQLLLFLRPSILALSCLCAALRGSAADAPFWLPSNNHWAGHTGGKGGPNDRPDGISNRIVALAAKVMVFHWDPQDTGPAVRLTEVVGQTGPTKVGFGPTVSNRLYDVYTTTDLTTGTWNKLTASPLTGTGRDLEYLDTAATGPRKFYPLQIATPVAP